MILYLGIEWRNYMSKYVIGDVHGEFEQLKELIKRMKIQENDELYILGDIVDRGPDSVKALQYLMTMSNCRCLAGNHELMLLENMKVLLSEITEDFIKSLSEEKMGLLADWINNGAISTISELSKISPRERQDILDYIGEFEAYIELEIKGQKYLLVHAGLDNFSDEKELDEYTIDELVWMHTDYEIPYFGDVIVVTGHTPTQNILCNPKPGYIYKANNHIALDCCACSFNGRLAGICLETGEEFYSRE